jgi:hypothetical protein
MAERIFKLKDETTAFHDPETGLKVVREQRAKIGTKIGKLTTQAIQMGRLIEVKPAAVQTVKGRQAAPAAHKDSD